MADLAKVEAEEYIWVNNDYTGVNSKEADPNVKIFVPFPIIKQMNDTQENSNLLQTNLTVVNESIPHLKQDEISKQDNDSYNYRSMYESKINELNELLKSEQKKTQDLQKLVKKLDTELNTKSKALQKAEEQIEEQKVKIEQLTSMSLKCESIEEADKSNSVLITKSKNESTEKLQNDDQKRKPLPEVPAENKKTAPTTATTSTTATTTVTSTNVILESNQQRESTTKLKISFKDFFAPVTNPRPVSTGMY